MECVHSDILEVQFDIDNLMLIRSFSHPMYQISRTLLDDEPVVAVNSMAMSRLGVFEICTRIDVLTWII